MHYAWGIGVETHFDCILETFHKEKPDQLKTVSRRLSPPTSNVAFLYLRAAEKIKFYSQPKIHGKGCVLGERYDENQFLQ
ncbi:hypothetical protein A2159_02015 [Candidatus Woesebacteria bacterium RBG_13_34_9]|uniref:Uncharacterized protein n=1 Tax=Candidatus Woesebacteria bacterium RBG_13_34_9 TaxID=1802477 RepID=A0A1F7X0R9_9BACT|nr:MAG: hypothetical protein A2159_02015 [Candidatus Woesebacteria bacterium RBG_13_34_9]